MNILLVYPHNNALNPRAGVDTRTWNLVSILLKNDYNISILHSVSARGNEDEALKQRCNVYYYKDLFLLGISDWYFSDLNPFFILKILKITRKHKIDVIIIEFPWGFFSTKFFSKKNSTIIFDSAGVESEFMEIAAQHPKFPLFLKPFMKIYTKLYEKLVCKLTNVIINVSDVDRQYYIDNYKINRNKTIKIQTPSSIVLHDATRTDDLKVKYRNILGLPKNKVIVIFHGGLPHPPNQEAFDLIENYIAPNINNSDILFVLAGNNLEEFRRDNIISLGFVKNLIDLLFSADFAIVPIISGSGMRVKCADYINTALPFIATDKGIEGIDFLEENIDYIKSKKVDHEFIDAINKLSKDEKLLYQFHKNLLEKSKKINRNVFENRFLKLLSKLKESIR
jgi:glycosyltransferase involved in cell wall biosynthesis